MSNENLTKKAVSGLSWMLTSSGVVFIIQFGLTVVLARIFTPIEFGIINATTIIVSLAEIFWMLGIGPALVQKNELISEDISTGFTFSVLFGSIICFLVFIFAPFLAQLININDHVIIQILSFSFVINSLGVVPNSLLQREMKFNLIVKKDILGVIVYGLFSIIFGLLNYGVWALVIALLAKYIVTSIILNIFYPHLLKIGFSKNSFNNIINFSIGYSLSRIFNVVASQGDYFIVTKFMGPAFLGIYSKAYQLISVPANLVGQSLDQVFFPLMSNIQNDDKKLSKVFISSIVILAIIMFPVGILMFFLSDSIILVLLGDKWIETVFPFKILSLVMFFRIGYKMSDPLCRAKGAVYKRSFVQLIYALMVIVFALIGTHWGLNGVAVGVSLSIVINFILLLFLTQKIVKFDFFYFLLAFIPVFLIAIITFLMTTYLSYLASNMISDNLIIQFLSLIEIIIIFFSLLFVVYKYVWPLDFKNIISYHTKEILFDIKKLFIQARRRIKFI